MPQSDIYGLGATLHQLLMGYDLSLTLFHFEPGSFDTLGWNRGKLSSTRSLGYRNLSSLKTRVGPDLLALPDRGRMQRTPSIGR